MLGRRAPRSPSTSPTATACGCSSSSTRCSTSPASRPAASQASLRADRPRRASPPTSPAASARPASAPACASPSTARRCREPVYVDRDMWEKIVLNLLSNAFKFTFEGGIAVRLRGRGPGGGARGRATPASASRRPSCRACSSASTASRAQRGRTHEGTGIGLALVQELVRLHGGQIEVRSARRPRHHLHGHGPARHGTPAGRPDRCCPRPRPPTAGQRRRLRRRGPALAPGSARHRSAGTAAARAPPVPCRRPRKRILLADDNADMRDYVRRLLAGSLRRRGRRRRRAALAAALASPPDLVLSRRDDAGARRLRAAAGAPRRSGHRASCR